MNTWYVYVVIDPKYIESSVTEIGDRLLSCEHRIVYVGLGTTTQCKTCKYDRIKSHIYNLNHTKNNGAFVKWIKKRLFEFNKEIIEKSFIKIAENLSKEEANKLEIKLISFFGRKDLKKGNLLNLTAGGEGSREISDELRKRMGIKNIGRFVGQKNGNYKKALTHVGKNNPFYGQKHTKDAILKMKRTYKIVDKITSKEIITHDLYLDCKKLGINTSNIFNYINKKSYKKRWWIEGGAKMKELK